MIGIFTTCLPKDQPRRMGGVRPKGTTGDHPARAGGIGADHDLKIFPAAGLVKRNGPGRPPKQSSPIEQDRTAGRFFVGVNRQQMAGKAVLHRFCSKERVNGEPDR